jgi:phosphoglycerate dehydrogenase-like enzyme
MAMTTILVHIHHPDFSLWSFPPELGARLRARFAERGVRFRLAPQEVEFGEAIAQADALLGRGLDAETLARATRLRWVQLPTAGVMGALFPELVESPVVLTNARGVHAVPMAEHLLGLMLALVRKIHLARDHQRAARWGQEALWGGDPPFDELDGKTLGVVGLGAVGSALAVRAHALGMRVLAVRRRPAQPLPPGVAEARGEGDLPWLLERSDFVADCLPHTRRTRRLFSDAQFADMRPGAYFLNVGRGNTVDEAALVRALESGRLGGAGLDVTAEEPLPAGSPLYSLPQVLLTPHVSGTSRRFWERAGDLFAENIERFLDGRPLRNVVDKREGY